MPLLTLASRWSQVRIDWGLCAATLVSLIYRCLIIEPFDIDVDRIGLIEMLGNTMSCDDSASAAYCFYHNGGLQIAPLTFAKRLPCESIMHFADKFQFF